MKTYFISVTETCTSVFTVEANNEEEAKEAVLAGDYIDVEYHPGNLDLDSNNWEIEEHEN